MTSPPDAIANGAVALVVERHLDVDVPQIEVDSVRAAMAPAAARFYGDPTSQLEVVGVTGTNGKTTTAFLVRALLEARRSPDGPARDRQERDRRRRASGAAHDPGGDRPAADVQGDAGRRGRRVRRSRSRRTRWRCTAQTRSSFAAAIFTNLTQDHLDFHPTMEDYFLAKRKLFVDRRSKACDRQRRRPVRGAAGRRAGRAGHVRDRRDGGVPRSGRADGPGRLELHGRDAGGGDCTELAAAGAVQRLQRAGGVRGGPCA